MLPSSRDKRSDIYITSIRNIYLKINILLCTVILNLELQQSYMIIYFYLFI